MPITYMLHEGVVGLSGKDDKEPKQQTSHKHKHRGNQRKPDMYAHSFEELEEHRDEESQSHKPSPEPQHV